MPNNVVEGPAKERASMLDGELDLRPILNTLVRWWKEIVAITAIVVIAAVGLFKWNEAQQVPMYSASANVAMVRTVSDVQFDERFRTISQDSVNPGDWANSARRNSLVGLVRNAAIAERVLETVGDQLPEEQQSVGSLVGRVWAEPVVIADAQAGGSSDLIRISAFGATPEDATLVANAWAEAYVDVVNLIYGQVPDELLNSVQQELTNAEVKYAEAQNALESFVATSRRDEINRAIFEKQEILDNLRRGRTTAISVMVDEAVRSRQQVISAYLNAQTSNSLVGFNMEQDAERALLTSYINAMSRAQLDVFQQQAQSRTSQLAYYYGEKSRNDNLLGDARALRSQIETGGENSLTSSSVALQVLKLQAFTHFGESNLYFQMVPPVASTQVLTGTEQRVVPSAVPGGTSFGNVPVGIPVDFTSEPTLAATLADLDALVFALEERVADAEKNIAELSAQMLSGDGYALLNVQTPDDSELATAIAEMYPRLFEPGALTAMSENVSSNTGLAATARLKAGELLELTELSELVDFSTDDQPLSQAVTKLSDEIQTLQGELASQNARDRELTQVRDLAWETLKTLQSKVAELTLARAAASTEVRLASPAIPPAWPIPGESVNQTAIISFAVGLTLALLIAFLAEYLGKRPFFAFRNRQPASSLSTSG